MSGSKYLDGSTGLGRHLPVGCVIMAPLASQGLGLLQGQQDEPVQMAPGVLALLGDLAGDVR